MATIQEYFINDFRDLSLDNTVNVAIKKQHSITGEVTDYNVEVKMRIQHNIGSTRLITLYVPDTELTAFVCLAVINDLEKFRKDADNIDAIPGFIGDVSVGVHTSVYSKRIYIYTERQLNPTELSDLEKVAIEKGIHITFRSQDYLARKMEIEKPMAFICHDSRDKKLIANPLAHGLSSRLCFVWYDEFSLKIGDSLRESIEKGIKEAKKCILILTNNFLNNPGWSKTEFNSIFTREMIMDERIILPVWSGVTKEEIYNYSPSLADRFALIWPNPTDITEDEYKKEVEKVISKIHTAITVQNDNP